VNHMCLGVLCHMDSICQAVGRSGGQRLRSWYGYLQPHQLAVQGGGDVLYPRALQAARRAALHERRVAVAVPQRVGGVGLRHHRRLGALEAFLQAEGTGRQKHFERMARWTTCCRTSAWT